jgi:hypothetical protein
MRHGTTILSLLFILTSCTLKSNENAIDKGQQDKSSIHSEMLNPDTSTFHTDTLTINNQQLVQTLKDKRFYGLTSLSSDTIVHFEDYYFKAEFVDIDEDGYKDIRVFAFSNSPNQCDNYFFDRSLKTYKRIEGSDLDIQLIKGTKLFYSYNRTGCADMNWESHLSKIENWKEVNIGFINTNACGDKNDGVYIYKVNGEKQTLIKRLPIKKFNNDKFEFIKQYWTKNYQTFKQ